MIINRIIKKTIKDRLLENKIIILYGARQVGKTSLSKELLSEYGDKGKYLNCELLSVQQGLGVQEASKLNSFLGDYELIVLDEAQNIENIGKILKIIIDTYPNKKIIATGSSSFDLANKVNEPLTGRSYTLMLFSFSIEEIKNKFGLDKVKSSFDNIMRFGMYPEIFFTESEEKTIERLNELASNYLYKDILHFEGIKKSNIIKKLLQLLALQLGNEVSYSEIGSSLGINRITVEKYIDILEQAFIVFRLYSFSRNLRKEISKSIKIYFYDLGIRNSLIQNFNSLDLRTDTGALWENFCILERTKLLKNNLMLRNQYFWRTYDQKEIDYIEEYNEKLDGYEFKFNKSNFKTPKEFLEKYKNASIKLVNKENYEDFVL